MSDLENRVSALERELAEVRNEVSLIPSIQRSYLELSARVQALEQDFSAYTVSKLPVTAPVQALEYSKQPADSGITITLLEPPFVPFGSIEKLVEYVERVFDCCEGDHRSAHAVYNIARGDYDYFPYLTLGLLAPATIPNAQERLRQAMATSFHKLRLTCKSERPVLYWRYEVQERILEDSGIETESKSVEPVKYKIMTRIAVPEASYSVLGNLLKPDGGPYAVLTG